MSLRDIIPMLDGDSSESKEVMTDGHGETEQPLLTRRQALGGIGAVLAGGAAVTTDRNNNSGKQENPEDPTAITNTPTATQTPEENTVTQTSTPEKTATSTPNHPDHYRIDMISPGEQPRTPQKWDDFHFQPDRIQSLAENWNQQVTYTQLVNDLTKENASQKYDGNDPAIRFPNKSNENGEYDYGHWSLEEFRNTTDAQDIITFATGAVRIHQSRILNGPPSTENDWFAATLNTIINDLYQPETDKNIIETGYIDQGGHGTVFTHTKTENTPLESKNNWWFIDTTGYNKISDIRDTRIDEGYNPLVQSYQPEPQTEQGYQDEKMTAEGALLTILDTSATNRDLNYQKISITDQLLDDIYNTHIRENDGDVEPILNTVEQAADYQVQTGEYIEIYGDSLDDIRFAAGGEQLYNLSMNPDTHLTTEKVEEFIAN